MNDGLGKDAEKKIWDWLDRPEDGYSFNRIYDNMNGWYEVSRNICDFFCYKYPNMYYIESKSTYADRFDFSMLSNKQRDGLRLKAEIPGAYGLVIVLYATYKRAFVFNIKELANFLEPDKSLNELNTEFNRSNVVSELSVKSLNIKKIDKWPIKYKEIQTIPNNRKKLLDYTGELEDLI